MKKKKKVVRYRKRIQINIGVIVFAFVLIYFLVSFISYLTAKHVSVYEVQQGQIVQHTTYTGLVLRPEKVTYAEEAGAVNYYKKEKDKAGYNDLICSIDQNGSIAKQIAAAGLDGTKLEKNSLLEIQSYISDFAKNQSDMQFYQVYALKEGVNAKIQENLYRNALNQLENEAKKAESQNTFSFVRAKTDGVLAFYTDGYEDVTVKNFKNNMYNPSAYTKINLKNNDSVSSGQALYKTVTNENWKILVPITAAEKKTYQKELKSDADSFTIHVTFKKDNTGAYATATLKNCSGSDYLVLNMNSSMVRFIADRYLEIELGNTNTSGLKIPKTAITEKEFLVIPKEYVGKGDNSSKYGVLKISSGSKNKKTVEFISTERYYETDDAYYVDGSDLKIGDEIQKQGSSDTYQIEKTAKLKGVFHLNKGYAIFKQIELAAENEEYAIVKSGTKYGISLYDHIALDSNSVKEGEIVN